LTWQLKKQQNSEGKEKEKLVKLYSQKSIEGEDITEVKKILDHLGARDYAKDLAEQYYYKALTQLEATQLDTSRQAPLKETACFLLKRNF